MVEKLAQTGLLKIIMGTDTLGVGVNIPIRSVLFTKLCKFDGVKTGILSVRDFKQIAGRAGRKGFDEEGSVLCQAPEHVIENKRQEGRFGADPKLKKKIIKKAAPTVNYVHWDEKTFQKLIDLPPEPLISRFSVSHGLIMTLLQAQDYRELIKLIAHSHETPKNKSKHRKQAAILLKSLIHAGLVATTGSKLVINEALQDDFSLHHTLSLYLLHALSLLDETDPEYALNILSLVESIAENPKVILMRQVDKLKNAKMAEMRAEGLEYEERMAQLEKIEHPKPLRDFIYDTFNAFEEKHPWIAGDNIQPKSVAREMYEGLSSFNEYVKDYGLERSEGVLLRYLSLTYKTLIQTVPESYQTDAFRDIAAYLKTLIAQTDSSLIAEWEQMLKPKAASLAIVEPTWVFDEKKFLAEIRAIMHQLVKALSQKNYEEAKLIAKFDYESALADYYRQYDRILWGPTTRLPVYTRIKKESELTYRVTQVLLDPDEHNEWFIESIAKAGPGLLKPEMIIERVES